MVDQKQFSVINEIMHKFYLYFKDFEIALAHIVSGLDRRNFKNFTDYEKCVIDKVALPYKTWLDKNTDGGTIHSKQKLDGTFFGFVITLHNDTDAVLCKLTFSEFTDA